MFTHNDKTSVFRLVGVVFVIPAFDGDKRKKQNINRTKRQAAENGKRKQQIEQSQSRQQLGGDGRRQSRS